MMYPQRQVAKAPFDLPRHGLLSQCRRSAPEALPLLQSASRLCRRYWVLKLAAEPKRCIELAHQGTESRARQERWPNFYLQTTGSRESAAGSTHARLQQKMPAGIFCGVLVLRRLRCCSTPCHCLTATKISSWPVASTLSGSACSANELPCRASSRRQQAKQSSSQAGRRSGTRARFSPPRRGWRMSALRCGVLVGSPQQGIVHILASAQPMHAANHVQCHRKPSTSPTLRKGGGSSKTSKSMKLPCLSVQLLSRLQSPPWFQPPCIQHACFTV